MRQDSCPAATAEAVVGVVADPAAGPAKIAQQLAQDLPGSLSEQLGDNCIWRVDVHHEQLPPSDKCHSDIMEIAAKRMQQRGWDVAVCITDLPFRSDRRPVVADVSNSRRVMVLSLPALGGVARRRQVRGVVSELIAEMDCEGISPNADTEQHRRGLTMPSRFWRVAPEQAGVDVRVLASWGRLRLLAGMVQGNRPWRLLFGLRAPLIGAFAFSVFFLINTSVWVLATTMGPIQLGATVVGAIAIMVTWLIAYHRLWEPTKNLAGDEHEEAVLSNASTVLTVAIGVGCMYGLLYLVNLTAAGVVLTPEALSQYVGHDPGFGEYAAVALLVTATSTAAGAVGLGFASEDTIREAAHGYRERERRDHSSV